MKRPFIVIISILMALGLSVIIIIQIMWIKNATKIQNEQFDNKVNTVMNKVVEKLESAEVILFFSQSYGGLVSDSTYKEEAEKLAQIISYFVNDTALYQEQRALQGDFLYDTIIPISKADVKAFKQHMDMPDDEENYASELQTDVDLSGYYLQQRVSNQTEKISAFMNKMLYSYNVQNQLIHERIDPDLLDDFIAEELQNNNIDQPYDFAVISAIDSSIVFASEHFDTAFIDSKYNTRLYPGDVFRKPYRLILHFPQKDYLIFKPISFLLFASLGFILILVILFSVSIYVMIRQRKISEIKNAFINNMTHEFKTPIATIRLASDSISNPNVLHHPEKVKHFSELINNETKRMNTQVEKVLQMALVEKTQFTLKKSKHFVHEMINKVLNNMKLQIESKHVNISFDDQASNDAIFTEEVHFLNMISNLIDNAIKYAKDKPEICITTKNIENLILIRIEDKGIGMSKDAQQRIFDKFYRVESGNVHNIKGFGLGLSYVKAIVDAHNGQISVKSEAGKGSCFEISLALCTK